MDRPRIGLVSDLDWTEGVGRYGLQLQRLLSNEFEIDLVYFNFNERNLELTRGGQIYCLGSSFRIPLIDNKPWFWQRVKKFLPQYDILHLISQNLAFLAPKKGNVVVTCHDIAPLFIPGRKWVKWMRKKLYSGLGWASVVIADSYFTATDISKVFGRDESEIKVIPLGVDFGLFRPLDKQECRSRLGLPHKIPIVLNLGIDKWRKNVAGVIKAIAQVRQKVPEVILVRIGSLSLKNIKLIKKLKINSNILVVPFCSDEQLVWYYNAADVFVFPSFYEGFGLPPLEAMACGTPVVAANRTSIPEVVGNAAVLVDPEVPDNIARGIERIIKDKALATALSEAGLQQAARFSWHNTARATAEIYYSLLGGR